MDSEYLVEDLFFSYALGNQKIEALNGVNMALPCAKIICFSGPSGSGKSTLLNILGLIEMPQEGRVLLRGENLSQMTEERKNEIRRYSIGFIFQQFHLLPVFTAAENVAYFLKRQGLDEKAIDERVKESLEEVSLWEYRHKRPHQLSGGQRQRVAIARALAKRPKILIGDEITASLDQKNGKDIMNVLVRQAEKKGTTIVLASHDPMVHEFADKNYCLRDGVLAC